MTNLTTTVAICGVPTCLFGQTGLAGRRRGGPESVQEPPGIAQAANKNPTRYGEMDARKK